MKYLDDELLKAYKYDLSQCPNIEDISSPLINISDVLKAHYILADYFTDPSANIEAETMMVGVRSYDLLYSAVCRQTCSYGHKSKYTDTLEICSTLFFGLVKDHAFHDGNKRTALLTLLNQMLMFGYYPNSSIYEFEKLVVAIAANKLEAKYNNAWKKFRKQDDQDIKVIAYLIRKMVDKKNSAYHNSITMKEFVKALEEQGVQCEHTGPKIKFTRMVPRRIFPKVYTYAINFYGWTRLVEAKMARDTLDELHITEEFPTSQSLFEGREPLYKIVAQFEEPLRRLKDK